MLTCKGGPPQVIVLPTPRGPQVSNIYPGVSVDEPACGAYKPKLMLDNINGAEVKS